MKLLVPFFAFLIMTACASRSFVEVPELVSIHLIDKDGLTEAISNTDRLKNFEEVNFLCPQPYQKVLRVYSRDCQGDVRAFITTYHPNGQIHQYLEILNNRACGVYKEWFANGVLKIDAVIVEGAADLNVGAEKSWLFDGCSRAYNECGELMAEIFYERGSLTGTSLYFHSNGTIWKEIPYKNNLVSGELSIYRDSGEILQSTMYENGVKTGSSLRYWPGGNLSSEENYRQGRLMYGVYTSYEGECVAQIKNGEGYRAVFSKDSLSELHEYHGGVGLGEVKAYNQDGALTKIYHVKNGFKHGEELFFYKGFCGEKPKPKLSIPWYEGKIQGIVKSWYDNLSMESQKEMSENVRNGVSTVWYRDGQLMMIEEYENDRLKKGDYYRKGYKLPLTQVINGEGTATIFDSEGNYLRKVPYLGGKPDK